MDELDDKNRMMSRFHEFENDNLGFNQAFQNPIITKLIVVQPKRLSNETTTLTPLEICEVNEISSNNNKVLSDPDSSSNGSIEELDISTPNKPENKIDFETNEENYSILMKSNKENSKEQKTNDIQKSILISPFEEELTFSELIMNPNSELNINVIKGDLHRFLLTPPPKNVIFKCQVNKTNNIDKTLLFTNFVFSFQICDKDIVSVNPFQALMIGHPNRKSKRRSMFISTDLSDTHSNSSSLIGHVKTNFLGTRFIFYSKNISDEAVNNENSTENLNDDTSSNQNLKDFNQMGVIFYKNSKFSSNKPRTMNAAVPNWDDDKECYDFNIELPKERNEALNLEKEGIISLENELPKYDETKKLYVLNFGGRVTEKSVKNFALNTKINGQSKRVFQMGKCKAHYIVDFTYPLCAFQAFAIALSCCQRKISTD